MFVLQSRTAINRSVINYDKMGTWRIQSHLTFYINVDIKNVKKIVDMNDLITDENTCIWCVRVMVLQLITEIIFER